MAKYRLSILAGWVLAADEQQARYGLTSAGAADRAGAGGVQRAHCLQALALYGENGNAG
jgi:uncharacterized protein (DUF58 family)